MANETPVLSTMLMDRAEPLGNSDDIDNRRALHTKIKNTPSEPISVTAGDYALRVDNTGLGYIFLGTAVPGSLNTEAKWLIQKITFTSTQVQAQFADGSNDYNQIWNDRASLTYV